MYPELRNAFVVMALIGVVVLIAFAKYGSAYNILEHISRQIPPPVRLSAEKAQYQRNGAVVEYVTITSTDQRDFSINKVDLQQSLQRQ